MNEVYRYSVIRFRPFAETGEFANIGIVMVSLASGRLGFELAPKRFPRIRGFFDPLIHEAYGVAIDSLTLELARVSEFMTLTHAADGRAAFDDLVERRESSIVFSDSRVVLGEGFEETLSKLFSRFIKRDSSAVDNPEVVLTRHIRSELKRNGIKQFKSFRIADDVVPVSFPLAYFGRGLRAIKPLAFSQKNPLSVFDYGAHWRKRLEYLLERGKVQERSVLIAVEEPEFEDDRRMRDAYLTARGELEALPFEIVLGEQNGHVNPAIVHFADDSLLDRHRLFH